MATEHDPDVDESLARISQQLYEQNILMAHIALLLATPPGHNYIDRMRVVEKMRKCIKESKDT